MTTLTPGPWTDMADASENASGVIRIKTPAGYVNATEADIAAMLLAPELLDSLQKLEKAYSETLDAEFSSDGSDCDELLSARATVSKITNRSS